MTTEHLHEQLERTLEHFTTDLTTIRAGQASPSLIEQVMVESYGTVVALQSLGSITASDGRTLVIQPWDSQVVKAIEKALTQANLGASPVVDGNTIRLAFPPLSEERREELVKRVNQKSEETKMRGKSLREDCLRAIKEAELPEDDERGQREEVQTEIDSFHETLKTMTEKKVKDIRTV